MVETVDSEQQDAVLGAFILGTMTSDRPSLVDRVPQEQQARLKTMIEQAGDDGIDAFDAMPTWFAAFIISELMMEGNGEESELGADNTLEAAFRAAGKPVSAIEEFLPIFVQLNMMEEEEQRMMLLDTLEEAEVDEGEDPLEMTHLWARGQPERLADDLSGEAIGERLYDILLRQRNSEWTSWLQERLEEPGTVLVAVGAGHLSGSDSLQTMLESEGLKVTRVD